MGILESDIRFTGSVGNLSAYRMKGTDKIIIRKKGGGSKKTIQNSPTCQGIRNSNAEFGGRATATKFIRRVMLSVKSLADYNFTSDLNKLVKPIQDLDTTSARGQRSILFSQNPKLLEGFSLNKNRTFESVVRTQVTRSINKKSGNATVTIPALMPGINFFPLPYHPLYSFVLDLGFVPDLTYDGNNKRYTKPPGHNFGYSWTQSDWLNIAAQAEPVTLSLTTKGPPSDDNSMLVLSIGIQYGTIGDHQSTIRQVAGVGSAKILGAI